MTDWDKFEAETANAPMSKIIDELKEQRRVRDDATKRVEQLEAKIVSEFPEEFGDQTKVYGDDVVTINRQERFNWDQDILDNIFKAKKSRPGFSPVKAMINGEIPPQFVKGNNLIKSDYQ